MESQVALMLHLGICPTMCEPQTWRCFLLFFFIPTKKGYPERGGRDSWGPKLGHTLVSGQAGPRSRHFATSALQSADSLSAASRFFFRMYNYISHALLGRDFPSSKLQMELKKQKLPPERRRFISARREPSNPGCSSIAEA